MTWCEDLSEPAEPPPQTRAGGPRPQPVAACSRLLLWTMVPHLVPLWWFFVFIPQCGAIMLKTAYSESENHNGNSKHQETVFWPLGSPRGPSTVLGHIVPGPRGAGVGPAAAFSARSPHPGPAHWAPLPLRARSGSHAAHSSVLVPPSPGQSCWAVRPQSGAHCLIPSASLPQGTSWCTHVLSRAVGTRGMDTCSEWWASRDSSLRERGQPNTAGAGHRRQLHKWRQAGSLMSCH